MSRLLPMLFVVACVASQPPGTPSPATSGPPEPVDFDQCYAPDCPYVGALLWATHPDADVWPELAAAVNGRYRFTWKTFGATRATQRISGAFGAIVDNEPEATTVRPTSTGAGTFVIVAHAPWHDTEVVADEAETIEAAEVASVVLDLPRYKALDPARPIGPVIVGSAFTVAVRLVAVDGRWLADLSMGASGDALVPVRWMDLRRATLRSAATRSWFGPNRCGSP